MATIHDLRKSISKMDDSEAFDLIKKRRANRRVAKASNKVAVKKAVAKRKAKAKASPKSLLSMLTPEQKAALISELGDF